MAKRRKFRDEDDEREYWSTRDSVDEIDWSKAARITLANLKPSVRSISLRLPESMLDALKNLANKQDIPYQSLIKVFLSERIAEELHREFEPRRGPRRRHDKASRPRRRSRALGSRA
jgi:predicted DNA binding CopG/RHH family protein